MYQLDQNGLGDLRVLGRHLHLVFRRPPSLPDLSALDWGPVTGLADRLSEPSDGFVVVQDQGAGRDDLAPAKRHHLKLRLRRLHERPGAREERPLSKSSVGSKALTTA